MTALLRVGPEHAAAMAAIHAASFPPAQRWDAAALGAVLTLPGALAWLDPAGGVVLARVAADEAEILTLAVAPALRRQGRGRALVEAAARACAEAGAAALFLEVAAGNEAARALYGGLGFALVGLRRRYYPEGGDALLLRRVLPQGP